MVLLSMSLTGTGMIIIVMILRALLIHKLPKKTFVILWTIVMIRLLLPLQFPSPFRFDFIVHKNTADVQSTVNDNANTDILLPKHNFNENTPRQTANTLINNNKPSTFITAKLLIYLWLTGIIISACIFLITYLKCYQKFQMSLPVHEEWVEQWKKNHIEKRMIEVRTSEFISSPLTYRVFHPTILFPKGMDWSEHSQLQYVFEHEYIHIKRYDLIKKYLLTIMVCIYWFNPLVWCMYILFNRDIELSCDEEVIKHFGIHTRSGYAYTLIDMEAKKSSLTPLYSGFSKNSIEERIQAIMKLKRNSKTTLAGAVMIVITAAIVLITSFFTGTPKVQSSVLKDENKIYLYGESHGVARILDKELELWKDYYKNQEMRDLFVELPYYTAQYLNRWMQAEDDEILDQLFIDTRGTQGNTPQNKKFYQSIKKDCPKTIFHGTDVGHQYDTTGARYQALLESEGLKDTDEYRLTKENIEQGKYYYAHEDDVYRENEMVSNFIREYEALDRKCIMGIYGGAHASLTAMDYATQTVPCMANQLNEKYKDVIITEDLTESTKPEDPIKVDTVKVAGKKYKASYFGDQDISSWCKDYISRKFWRLENAYDDFKSKKKTGEVLPYNNYPMKMKEGQVFMIEYTKRNHKKVKQYLISDGRVWEGDVCTEVVNLK